MAISISDLKVGDVLYDVHREKAGNTNMSYEGVWEVYVKDVGEDESGPWVDLSWNGNPAERRRSVPRGWKQWPKEWVAGRGERRCYICDALEHQGHESDCEHPRAVAARKRAKKAAKLGSKEAG